ncbi:MAG: hypothetical protein J5936_05625, partial [Acholeplasmatales bacterium]|nr:hypothetical protein [Acholeplasmatales bacterium]
MEIQALCYLLSYACELGLIENINPSPLDINNLIENKEKFSFDVRNGASYVYDFNDPISEESEQSVRALRDLLPICGIIDLVYESIKLGVVTDISKDFSSHELKEFDGDYSKVVEVPCFYFK